MRSVGDKGVVTDHLAVVIIWHVVVIGTGPLARGEPSQPGVVEPVAVVIETAGVIGEVWVVYSAS